MSSTVEILWTFFRHWSDRILDFLYLKHVKMTRERVIIQDMSSIYLKFLVGRGLVGKVRGSVC